MTIHRVVRLALACAVVLGMQPLVFMSDSRAHEIGDPAFVRSWERTDRPVTTQLVSRTWMWGPAGITPPVYEPYADAPGGQRLVQYFDKTRKEINNPNADASSLWYVTNGLLALELITGRMQIGDHSYAQYASSTEVVAGDPHPDSPTYDTFRRVMHYEATPTDWTITQRIHRNGDVTNDAALETFGVTVQYHVSETNHTVASVFWSFMNSNGLIYDNGVYREARLFEAPFAAVGLPVTEAYWAHIPVGGVWQDVLIQCFERCCVTYTPGNSPGWQVEAGNVGRHYLAWSAEARPPSIQSIIDAAAPGSVVRVPKGIYRESVRINKPLTLIGEPGAEIRGSDDWSNGWTQQGGYWVRGSLPNFTTHNWPCAASSNWRCILPHQVFVDGQPVFQVWANPGSGQFAVNDNRQIVLADNPTGRLVEVTTREHWVVGRADDVVIQGFTMKHAATPAQTGALNNGSHSNWRIQDNILSDAHGAAVSLWGGENLHLIDNDISRNGQLGVHGWNASDVLVRGNRIYNNNTEAFQMEWEAGGLKMAEMERLTVDANEVFENFGPGIWCDIDCLDVVFSANRVSYNARYGINYETSSRGVIRDNVVYGNGFTAADWGWGAGILVQNSRDTEVHDNVVAWNADGISIISQSRGDSPTVVNNLVRDNSIMVVVRGQNQDVFLLAWLQDWSGGMASQGGNNRGANNRYFYMNPGGAPEAFRYVNQGFQYSNLNGFNQTNGENGGTYLNQAQVDQVLSQHGIPAP